MTPLCLYNRHFDIVLMRLRYFQDGDFKNAEILYSQAYGIHLSESQLVLNVGQQYPKRS